MPGPDWTQFAWRVGRQLNAVLPPTLLPGASSGDSTRGWHRPALAGLAGRRPKTLTETPQQAAGNVSPFNQRWILWRRNTQRRSGYRPASGTTLHQHSYLNQQRGRDPRATYGGARAINLRRPSCGRRAWPCRHAPPRSFGRLATLAEFAGSRVALPAAFLFGSVL